MWANDVYVALPERHTAGVLSWIGDKQRRGASFPTVRLKNGPALDLAYRSACDCVVEGFVCQESRECSRSVVQLQFTRSI